MLDFNNIRFSLPQLCSIVQGQGLSFQLRDFAPETRFTNISRQM